jgi:hypothetical protein
VRRDCKCYHFGASETDRRERMEGFHLLGREGADNSFAVSRCFHYALIEVCSCIGFKGH